MKIPKDKIMHLLAGFLISLTALIIPPYIAISLVFVAGVSKEVYDIKHGTVDIWDAAYTALGGLPVCLVALL